MVQLVRDPVRVKSHLKQRSGSIYTDAPCRIQVPARYQDRHLVSISAETYIVGIFALIIEGYYSVSITNAMMRITPSSTEHIDIDGVEYLEFHFEKGDQVIYSTDLVKNDTLVYYIYDEHVAKGRIPWYLNYFDLSRLFETADLHGDINLGNRAVIDLIMSTIARNPQDYTQLYRHVIFKPSDIISNPPVIVPFRSVIWNASDTTSKLIGAHFGDSITSALVNPSDQVERIEELLRT